MNPRIEQTERSEIAIKIYEQTDLTLREIAEIVNRSESWVMRELNKAAEE